MDLSDYDEEKGTTNDEVTHCHPAFDCFAIAEVDEMIEKVGGNDADANLRLQAVIKLLESRKMSVDVEMKSPQAQAKDSTHISRQASTIGFASITSDHLLFKTSPPKVVSLVLETIGKFDTDDDGRLSIEEVVVGMIMMANAALESAKTKNRLLWSILGLSVSTIALVFVAAFASKDLAVSDGTLTAKGSIQPLETAVHNPQIHLSKPVGDTENEGESLDTKLNLDVLGCMTPDDVEALKLGSFAVPASLRTENGDIHALQVHDWKENDNGVITILDTSSIPYVIKSDPACASVIKHGRHLQENGGLSLSWSDNVDWECVFSVNDKGVEGGACCNDGSCPGGNSLLCVAGTCYANICGGNGQACCTSGTECFGPGIICRGSTCGRFCGGYGEPCCQATGGDDDGCEGRGQFCHNCGLCGPVGGNVCGEL